MPLTPVSIAAILAAEENADATLDEMRVHSSAVIMPDDRVQLAYWERVYEAAAEKVTALRDSTRRAAHYESLLDQALAESAESGRE